MGHEISKITTNTLAQLVGKAFSSGTTLTATAVIARKFGEGQLGVFFLMTGFASYFYLLTDFGMNAIATRELSADFSKAQKYFNNLLTFRLLEALVIILVLFLIVPFIPFRLSSLGLLKLGIVIGLMTIFSQAIYNCCTVIFQTTLSYQKLVIASVVGNLIFLSMVFWLVFYGYGILSLVVANTVGTMLVSGISLYLVYRSVGKLFFEFDFGLWKSLIVTSLPLGIGIVLTMIVAKSDQFLLSVLELPKELKMANDVALGNYGLSYKIFENILVFPTYFVNAVYPLLVRNRGGDERKFKKIFWYALLFMVVTSFVVTVLGWLFAPLAIKIVGGSGFILAPAALRILLLGLPLFFTSALFLFLMIAQNQQNKVPFIYLGAAILNVVLNLIFIPSYGFIASAWITGATELLILVLVAYFGLKGLRPAPRL